LIFVNRKKKHLPIIDSNQENCLTSCKHEHANHSLSANEIQIYEERFVVIGHFLFCAQQVSVERQKEKELI
jgi:hypothetical protein